MKNKIVIDCKTLDYIKSIERRLQKEKVENPYEKAVLLWLNKELKICKHF